MLPILNVLKISRYINFISLLNSLIFITFVLLTNSLLLLFILSETVSDKTIIHSTLPGEPQVAKCLSCFHFVISSCLLFCYYLVVNLVQVGTSTKPIENIYLPSLQKQFGEWTEEDTIRNNFGLTDKNVLLWILIFAVSNDY